MAIFTPQGIILNILPLFKNDLQFVSFNSIEEANGFMPTIEIKIRVFKDITKVGDVHTIKLINSYGAEFSTKAYVYSLSFVQSHLTIKLMPVEPDFMRKVKTATYKGGESALSSVWKQKIDKNVQSDILNNVSLFQKSETDYNFINKVLRAFKYNTIFAYTLNGLIIRNLNDSSFVEKKTRQGETKPMTSQEISDPKRYGSSVGILERFTNHVKIRVYDKIYDVNKEYETLIGNLAYFDRFKSAKSDYVFETKELYSANLCEGIQYYSKDTRVENTFIQRREINIFQTEAKVSYTMRSINP